MKYPRIARPAILRSTLITAALLMASCTTSQGLSARTDAMPDGSRVISIAPHGTACKKDCLLIGGQWSSRNANQVQLDIGSAYAINAIIGATLIIDGEAVALKEANSLTQYGTDATAGQSEQAFIAPVDILEDLLLAETAVLLISTTNGERQDWINAKSFDSKAYHALDRLNLAIKNQ